MMTKKYLCTSAIAAALLATLTVGGATSVAAAEYQIKAAGPWNKNHPMLKNYFRFIEKANKAGKGLYKITYIGGPEITKARQQPKAMRNGLIDMIYGPPAYYLGLFPEGDFAHGFKNAMEQRAAGAFDIIQEPLKKKMGARFIARFDSGVGLLLFLKNKPKMESNGLPDLTGLKLRSSPTYRNFIQDLGGTAVIMGASQVYTALERGVVDGAGFSLNDIRSRGAHKFLKYMIDPPFTYATISVVMSVKKWDAMPKKARDVFMKEAIEWEKTSRQHWLDLAGKERENLKKVGMTIITLKGQVAKDYRALFLKGPWERMSKNPKVTVDMKKLKKAAY